jgi:hypothetical protein
MCQFKSKILKVRDTRLRINIVQDMRKNVPSGDPQIQRQLSSEYEQ